MVDETLPRIGVIGGTGLYRLKDSAQGTTGLDTVRRAERCDGSGTHRRGPGGASAVPWSRPHHPSAPHPSPCHVWALHSLGVERIIAACAVGSLRPDMAPGDIVICDHFIDHTGGRHQTTFFDGPEVAHAGMAEPYYAELRPLAAAACRDAGFTVHRAGTVTVVAGPPFLDPRGVLSVSQRGRGLIKMTQYPEVALARAGTVLRQSVIGHRLRRRAR